MSETDFKHLSPDEAAAIGYERTEPNSVKIAILTVAIVITIVITCYFVWWWYVWQKEEAYQREQARPVWQETKDVRAYETERLTQYKFIDKAKGSVALPIGRAMELLAKEEAEGKSFYAGKALAVKPTEVDPNLQTVIDKALGKTSAPAAAPAAGAPAPAAGAPAPAAGAAAPAPAKNDGQAAAPAASKH